MSESPTPTPDAPATPSPKPGDGEGPNRLRASLSGTKRGAYKCKRCGEKHGEGAKCGDGFQRPPGKPVAPEVVQPAVFTPENTGRLLRAPFTIAAVRTNCRIWLLTEKEEAELVATAVPCANEWVKIDPKWAALFMFSYSLAGVALSKAMDYSAWREQMNAELAEAARQAKAKAAAEQPAPKNSAGGLGPTETPPSPSTV